MRFEADRGIDRDLAALVGLGLPGPEGLHAARHDSLKCRSCAKRGTTLHHVIPNWVRRETGAEEILESLCPACHAAAERIAWEAAEAVLRRADLLDVAGRSHPALRPAIAAWNEWTRWSRRLRNLESAGRDPVEARANEAAARRRLAPVREKLRDAIRRTAAKLCLEQIDYRAMVERWRASGVACLDPARFVQRGGRASRRNKSSR